MATRVLALALTLTLVFVIVGGGGARAQDASPSSGTPSASPDAGEVGADLAAMALDSSVMPDGYSLAGESYVDLDGLAQYAVDVGALGSVEELAALGVVAQYDSFYATEGSGGDLRSYVVEYETAADVQGGFDILEDESFFAAQDEWTDEPGLAGVGETPSEITTIAFQAPEAGAGTYVDITFRVDRFQVGVSGTAYGEGATVDQDVLKGLAAELEERVAAVLAGEEIDGIDDTLPGLVPTLDSPFRGEGYVTAEDAFGELVGAVDVDAFVSAFTRDASFAADPQASPGPILFIGVGRFTGGEALDLVREPAGIVPSEGQHERTELEDVAGNPAVGYTFVSDFGTGEADSFRVYVAVDDLLLVVDVVGITSVEEAETLALGFAEDTVACATGGESCGPLAISPELGVPAATPEASPEASPVS